MNLENKAIVDSLNKKRSSYKVKAFIVFIVGIFCVYLFYNEKVVGLPYLLALATIIVCVVLFIYYLARAISISNEVDKYCPYCYTKDFIRTTLKKTKIRSYVKKDERTDSNGKKEIKRTLIEDWEGQYRNECCGKVYTRTWQERISLD